MSVIKSHIKALSAYKPPIEDRDPSRAILLDFNERTVGLPSELRQALHSYIDTDCLHVYPAYSDSTALLASFLDLPTDMIMLTNGSDQAIELIIRATAPSNSEVLLPDPTFPIYEQYCAVEGLKIQRVPYSSNYEYPAQELSELVSESTSLVVVPNPNNPTGTAVNKNTVSMLCERAPHAAILVDECYCEYSGSSVVALVEKHSNLFITRTFSKTWGLAGLRIGYIISQADNIHELLKIRGPYDVNRLAVAAMRYALKEPAFVQNYVREVVTESKPLLEQYLRSRNVTFWPSAANFLYCKFENPTLVFEELKKRGILVRPRKERNGSHYIRITIGTKAQIQRLIAALDDFLS